ncbi:MAG: hypothetical protein HYZ53_25860 [Planctomycetes bacterium]|nr:hypothetical protein [Planctomycetota bacterium]
MHRLRLLLLGLALVATAGCLERKEGIVIAPDGSASLTVQVKGDPNDVRAGDPLPSAQTGWTVRESSEFDNEGKETLVRAASLSVAAGAPLPSSYAAAADPARDAALAFPTSLKVEQGPAGTYYHFSRVYRGRTWQAVEYHREQALGSDEMKQILKKDPKEMSEDERSAVVRALLECGRRETSTYLHQALADSGEAVPQQAFLAALRAALEPYAKSGLATQATELLARNAGDEIVALAERLNLESKTSLEASLSGAGLSGEVVRAFVERCEFHRRARDVSSDLSDERWEVNVTLPGRIVDHNSLDAQEGADAADNRVLWRFDGKALQDRDVVLLATSFLPSEEEKRK